MNGLCLSVVYNAGGAGISQTEAKARCAGHLADIKTQADRDALLEVIAMQGENNNLIHICSRRNPPSAPAWSVADECRALPQSPVCLETWATMVASGWPS